MYLKDKAEINKTIPKIIIVTLDAKPNRLPLPPEMAKRYEKDIKISVHPTATSLPITGGPPPERRKINVKLLKLNAKLPINNGEIGKFDYISLEGNNFYKIILSTGKNREIRNSLSYINIKTMKLHRSKYSFIELDDMKEGEYRYLNNRERELIF